MTVLVGDIFDDRGFIESQNLLSENKTYTNIVRFVVLEMPYVIPVLPNVH